ncbi:uncharacterized protein LOC130613375 [Hydractinia symbiolongicarpus]|uniref:uncharacterized protein LOC130613375 n=1 Tax=Hydractinia symbiolongicarpus TaxID=13093 RepID=UPI002550A813|nr:uncharacterized protein LOC130613375 [Hydractinia symbiolongicarpus]
MKLFFALVLFALFTVDQSIANVKNNKKLIRVTLAVEFVAIGKPNPPPQTFFIQKGTYAIDAFLKKNSTQCYNIVYTVSKFGAYITTVCDVKQTANDLWFFYINNKESPVGVSCYEVKNNDKLTLSYETYPESQAHDEL